VRWIFDSFRFKNEFPEFIPSLALVSVVSAASESVFTERLLIIWPYAMYFQARKDIYFHYRVILQLPVESIYALLKKRH